MDSQLVCCLEIDFIGHQLIECKAVKNETTQAEPGGNVTFEVKVEVPSEPVTLKVNDTFEVKISLDSTGIGKNSKEPAFQAFCKMVGTFHVIDCPEEGIATKNNMKLLSRAATSLYPLLAQFVEDLIAKMGFKGVEIPSFAPRQMVAQKKQTKTKTKKQKEVS